MNVLAAIFLIAAGSADVDGDGVPDRIRIETRDPVRSEARIEGHFEAAIELSTKRIVRTPISIHERGETLWFVDARASRLAIADYNADGRPDFNLGQYTNNTKWEYALFTIHPDGHVEPLAHHQPEIYVSPGGEPSTKGIEAIDGGFRFRDFGNAGESPGWWTFTCLWQRDRGVFQCTGEPTSRAPRTS